MKYWILLAAGCSALLGGCATGTGDGARLAAREADVVTGSRIARRTPSPGDVKSVSREEVENARMAGESAVSVSRN